ncbi:MAG: outer membrane protein [Cyclobacteriaceae bacterium]|jgi:outer membrane protein
MADWFFYLPNKNRNKMRHLLMLFIIFISLSSKAQQDSVVLSLDDCISIGLDRNIQLKRAKNNQMIAEANRFQSIMNFFPSVNASMNYDYFFGTFFDTNVGAQVSATSSSSQPNINANLVLFNGLQNHHNVKRAHFSQEAAEYDVKSTHLDVETNILVSYLRVILDRENAQISADRVVLLKKQLEREQKRVTVGVGNLESVYNMRSQLATERLNLTNLENTYRSDLLTLLQAMQFDPSEAAYEVLPYNISEAALLLDLDPFDQVLNESLAGNPALNAAHARKKASEYQFKIAKAGRSPRLTWSGAIGSNYSSNGAFNPSTGEREPNATWKDQLEYNEYEYMEFRLSIPIFTRFQTTNAVQNAKFNISNAELDVNQAMNTVTNVLQQAYLDLVSAQTTYTSAKENLEALDQTFVFMKKRFDTGNTNFYVYLESLNNKNVAEVQLVNAKYNIIFRKKVLDLYRGL